MLIRHPSRDTEDIVGFMNLWLSGEVGIGDTNMGSVNIRISLEETGLGKIKKYILRRKVV